MFACFVLFVCLVLDLFLCQLQKGKGILHRDDPFQSVYGSRFCFLVSFVCCLICFSGLIVFLLLMYDVLDLTNCRQSYCLFFALLQRTQLQTDSFKLYLLINLLCITLIPFILNSDY